MVVDAVLLKKLIDNLKFELKLQSELLELLTLERSEIVHLKSEELDKLRVKKEVLVGKLDENKETRKDLITPITPNPDPKNPLTLTQIFETAPESLKTTFSTLAEDLRKTLATVNKLHTENSGLLKQSLSLVSSTISILSARSLVNNTNYQKDGKTTDEKDSSSSLGSSNLSAISSFNRSA